MPATETRFDKCTPVEMLVIETLTARHRLGHPNWTFGRNPTVTSALLRLKRRGIVGFKSGIIENSWLVWFTDAGRDAALSDTYEPPSAADPFQVEIPDPDT
jgi:hypothetical protein